MSEDRFPDAPARIRALPRDHRGFPVPWFVAWIDGKPDFRVIGPNKIGEAVGGSKCWICGERLGRFVAYTIGPMCAVNRVSAEPPAHLECATFAAQACPFLANPRMRRNGKDLPEDAEGPAGTMIERNPGVALVWVTRTVKPFRVDNGLLFDVGEPAACHWFAHGRKATRDEVKASIESGLPLLEDAARRDGPAALAELTVRLGQLDALLPAGEDRPDDDEKSQVFAAVNLLLAGKPADLGVLVGADLLATSVAVMCPSIEAADALIDALVPDLKERLRIYWADVQAAHATGETRRAAGCA